VSIHYGVSSALINYSKVISMPLVRRIIGVGDSRAVTLPSDWLKFAEDKAGQAINEVLMEVNGAIRIELFIRPKNPNVAR